MCGCPNTREGRPLRCLGCIRLTKQCRAGQNGAEQSRAGQRGQVRELELLQFAWMPSMAENILVVLSSPLSTSRRPQQTVSTLVDKPAGGQEARRGKCRQERSLRGRYGGARLRSLQYVRTPHTLPYEEETVRAGQQQEGGGWETGKQSSPGKAGTNAASPRQQACRQAAGTEQEPLGYLSRAGNGGAIRRYMVYQLGLSTQVIGTTSHPRC